jgi:ferric-dicitrate binding protein FerR (iron transport regulator)
MEGFQLKKYIKLFLEGKLKLSEENDLLSWIKKSPGNKDQFYKFQKIFSDELICSNQVDSYHDPEKLKKIIDPGVDRPASGSSIIWKYCYNFLSSRAAAFIAGFLITLLIFLNIDKPDKEIVTEQKISVPYGARTQFLLPDSSLVWLNSGSEIVFPDHFNGSRPVTLKGEAFFQIKEDNLPFVVETTYGNVEVKGTSFNVKAYSDDLFETTTVTGVVNVLTENNQEVAIRPGYQAVFTGKELEIRKVETSLYTSWTEGKLIFRKEYLPMLAKRFERWYNVNIDLDDDNRLNGIYYTGVLEMESFSEVLNLLKVTAPVDYSWDDKTRVIKIYYKKNNL